MSRVQGRFRLLTITVDLALRYQQSESVPHPARPVQRTSEYRN